MSDDKQPSGFLGEAEAPIAEPEAPAPQVNGAMAEDALEHIAGMGDGYLSVVAERLRQIEQHVPDAIKMAQGVTNIAGRLGELEKAVGYLSQQRAIAEVQMERQVRAVALDMAIKALPDAVRSDPEAITRFADAFLGWLKAGAQA